MTTESAFPQEFINKIEELGKFKLTCKSESDKRKYDVEVCSILGTYGYPFRISKRGEKRADKLSDKYYRGERLADDELKDACGLLVIRSSQKNEHHLFNLIKEVQEEMYKRFSFKFNFKETGGGEFTDFLLNRGYIEQNPDFIPALLDIQLKMLSED